MIKAIGYAYPSSNIARQLGASLAADLRRLSTIGGAIARRAYQEL